MTTANKSSATDRGTRSKVKAKRKLPNPEPDPSAPPRKQHKSITEHFSQPHDTADIIGEDEDDQPRSSVRRLGRQSPPNHKASLSVTNMYTFTSSKSQTGEVVDLTKSSPPTSPQSPIANKALANRSRKVAFNPLQGPKKLVVKNLRTAPRVDPEQYFLKVWGQIDVSLTAIFNNEKSAYSLEELYRGAENVCRQGRAAELYRRVRERCQDHVSENVRAKLIKEVPQSSDTYALKSFVEAWKRWSAQLVTVRSILYYMDQTYLLRSAEHPSVTETGLELFRDIVFANAVLKPKILHGTVQTIDLDRDGCASEGEIALLKSSIDTLHELDVYTSDFEPTFKDSSESYFRVWRKTEAEKAGLAHYADACTKLLQREMTRCDLFKLDRSSRAQLCELFDTILVEEDVDLLTDEDSLIELFKNDEFIHLEEVYLLLNRKRHVGKLGAPFNRYIIEEGTAIVFDEKRESEMVVNLLDFKRKLDHISKVSFNGKESLNNGLHKAFETFMNKTQKTQANWDTDNAKPGEMIAKHVDLLLKGGVKAIPKLASSTKNDATKGDEEHDFDDAPADEDAEINMHLSNALDLFRFVHGKAVFEAFYKKDLARRLLMGRSASNDAERNMLTRLKNECGAGFTHNLESMFKDMDLARDEMSSYIQLMDDRGTRNATLDLNVNVLSSSAWPTYPDVPVNIPTAIMKTMSDFETHYKAKHSGRKLAWKHALAHCQVKAKFPRGNKELVVSGFQAIVLLLFNDVPADGTLSYNEIKTTIGLPDAELKRTLQSLACAKYRVLSKTPKGRDINETDVFGFNSNFHDQKLRIKINQIQLKETKEENKETHQRVAADRHYETQAAIVRIMKSRKTIRHVELIAEVIKATKSRGVLDPADIKKNIEKLIEKDYMEREEGNSYSYVA